jgi:hypothetical protein
MKGMHSYQVCCLEEIMGHSALLEQHTSEVKTHKVQLTQDKDKFTLAIDHIKACCLPQIKSIKEQRESQLPLNIFKIRYSLFFWLGMAITEYQTEEEFCLKYQI